MNGCRAFSLMSESMNDNVIFALGCGTGSLSTLVLVLLQKWYMYRLPVAAPEVPDPLPAAPRPINTAVASASHVQDAVVIHIIPPDEALVHDTCIVCMEEYSIKQSVVECTSCHVILGHASCLESWFQRQLSCPHCRTQFYE